MTKTQESIQQLIDYLMDDIEKNERFLSVPDVNNYYDGRRRLALSVIASLDAILSVSERVSGAERY